MANLPVAGILAVRVPAKGSQPIRDAKLQVRYKQVTLKSPAGKGFPPVEVWAVFAQETDYPQTVISPLEWVLVTTIEVQCFKHTCERLSWYAGRWCIEVYYRTLKSGWKNEDRQLQTADSLEVFLAVDMVVALRIHHLTKIGSEVPNSPCTIFFEETGWKAMHTFVNKTHEFPEKEPTISEATRMVATLGDFLAAKVTGSLVL